jgi:hypothetical protein
VNPVSLDEDVFLHFGIPFESLVSEVDAGFQELFH